MPASIRGLLRPLHEPGRDLRGGHRADLDVVLHGGACVFRPWTPVSARTSKSVLPPNVEHRAKNPEGIFGSLISPSNPGEPAPGAGHNLDQGAVLDVLTEDELMND